MFCWQTKYRLGEAEPLSITYSVSFGCTGFPENSKSIEDWINRWEVSQIKESHAKHALLENVSAWTGIGTEDLHDNWKVSRAKFVVTPGGVFANDYNSDGKIDLLVTDPGLVRLYKSNGDLTFEDVTLEVGLPLRVNSHLAGFADLDSDGDQDLILGTSILENRNGRFLRANYIKPIEMDSGISFVDFDQDGLLDFYVSRAAPAPKEGGEESLHNKVSRL